MKRSLEGMIPDGVTLRVYHWQGLPEGEKLHPRCVLTDVGGAKIDYGLDEGEGAGDTTWVTLLEHPAWQTLWRDYSEEGTAFALPAEGIIAVRGIG